MQTPLVLSSSPTCLVRYRLFYRREIYYTDEVSAQVGGAALLSR